MDNNNCEKEIGRRIAHLRNEKGMTQAELAKRMGISQKHLSEVERGISSLSLEKLISISAYFGCSLDYLIKGEDLEMIMRDLPGSVREILTQGSEDDKKMLKQYMNMYLNMKNTFTEKTAEGNMV